MFQRNWDRSPTRACGWVDDIRITQLYPVVHILQVTSGEPFQKLLLKSMSVYRIHVVQDLCFTNTISYKETLLVLSKLV